MMKKLKNGVILFFFVITAFSALVIDRYYFTSDGENWMIMNFVIFGTLVLSLILSFSLAELEEKIKENKYSLRWLIKLYLFSSLFFYIALVVFAVVYISPLGLLMYGIWFHAFWIAPLAVLIFNFIPSLFFYRFYSSKYF